MLFMFGSGDFAGLRVLFGTIRASGLTRTGLLTARSGHDFRQALSMTLVTLKPETSTQKAINKKPQTRCRSSLKTKPKAFGACAFAPLFVVSVFLLILVKGWRCPYARQFPRF